MKSHELLFTPALGISFSPSIKAFSFPCCGRLACGSPWLQTLNCNSLLILNKPIFVGEISGTLFVLGQHFGGP